MNFLDAFMTRQLQGICLQVPLLLVLRLAVPGAKHGCCGTRRSPNPRLLTSPSPLTYEPGRVKVCQRGSSEAVGGWVEEMRERGTKQGK